MNWLWRLLWWGSVGDGTEPVTVVPPTETFVLRFPTPAAFDLVFVSPDAFTLVVPYADAFNIVF